MLKNIRLAYLPTGGRIRIRLSGKGNDQEVLKEQLQIEIRKLSRIVEMYIISYEDQAWKILSDSSSKKTWKLATAKSCTAGLIASKIISIAGSFTYY
ncbi:MAG: CinA family protein [Flavobacteriales bacterium AspAUS03]